MSYWLLMVPSLRLSVGVQLGWSTTVWGFQSGKVIDDCEYLQVRDSNKCPEGDLPTWDTHLRPLALALAVVSRAVSSANARSGPMGRVREAWSRAGVMTCMAIDRDGIGSWAWELLL